MTNKYAEGYPHKRYYGGCECVAIGVCLHSRLISLQVRIECMPSTPAQHPGALRANPKAVRYNQKLFDEIIIFHGVISCRVPDPTYTQSAAG